MDLKIIDAQGKDAGVLSASDALFAREYSEALVHQVVVAYLANARSGNRAQKGRSEVARSTKKPFRQKGTGRARVGMASSPLWRGGGKIFPSSPEENFTQKINRKMYRAAMASIYSQLVREGRLQVVSAIDLKAPKTKEFVSCLGALGVANALVIDREVSENLFLASRNVPNVLVLDAAQVDPYSLVRYDRVLVTREAVQAIEELLA